MTTWMSHIVPAVALVAATAGLFAGAEVQAIKDARAGDAKLKTGQLLLGQAEFGPYRQAAVHSPSDAILFDTRIEFTERAGEISPALPPAPIRRGALAGLEDAAAKGDVHSELCTAPLAEAYSHVGIADEAVRPFASCLR